MKRYAMFFLLLLCGQWALAQTKLLKGTVINEAGQPIKGVKVVVEDAEPTFSDAQGEFTAKVGVDLHNISDVSAMFRGYKVQDWGFTKDREHIRILMTRAPIAIKGRLLSKSGQPLSGVQIKMGVAGSAITITDIKGQFALYVPTNTKVNNKSTFLVNGEVVAYPNFNYNTSTELLTINFKKDVPQVQQARKPVAPASRPVAEVVRDGYEIGVNDMRNVKVNPTLIVVVYDSDISPAKGVRVRINNQQFQTNEKGEFRVVADSINNSDIQVEDYQITKRVYDPKDGYMFVHIKRKQDEPVDEQAEVEYTSNFHAVFNSLEVEKQLLAENGQELRKEINLITEKLQLGSLSESQKRELNAYLERLQNSLIDNELAYEDAQHKTRLMLDQMKTQINEKDEKIVQVEEEKASVRREMYITIFIAAMALVLLLVFLRISRKLKRQRDELKQVYLSLQATKNEIVKAHEEMLAVKDIGQKFTARLDFDQYMPELQDSVAMLLDSPIFGIGTYNSATRRIEFINMVADGLQVPMHTEGVEDPSSLAAWCFKNEVEVVINDLPNEYFLYVPEAQMDLSEDAPQSIIYMPLFLGTHVVGVLTMQSYKKQAYARVNVSNLKSLASFAAIAVANYKAYRELKLKNQSITDSMRYAKTMQAAILPTEDILRKAFQDAFIFYRSKDIVSGDFYWFSEQLGKDGIRRRFLAVVDCTGHGVPGAFMSMIGNTLLNEIVNAKGITDTIQAVNLLNEGVKATLRQDQNDDGMDVCLCCVEEVPGEDAFTVHFTGAKRPLYLYTNGELRIIQGDIKSVGSASRKEREFTREQLLLHRGDMLYLTTDGFIDQNNLLREKFGTTRLIQLLEAMASEPMELQSRMLVNAMAHHQGNVEQRDDITVVGIKL